MRIFPLLCLTCHSATPLISFNHFYLVLPLLSPIKPVYKLPWSLHSLPDCFTFSCQTSQYAPLDWLLGFTSACLKPSLLVSAPVNASAFCPWPWVLPVHFLFFIRLWLWGDNVVLLYWKKERFHLPISELLTEWNISPKWVLLLWNYLQASWSSVHPQLTVGLLLPGLFAPWPSYLLTYSWPSRLTIHKLCLSPPPNSTDASSETPSLKCLLHLPATSLSSLVPLNRTVFVSIGYTLTILVPSLLICCPYHELTNCHLWERAHSTSYTYLFSFQNSWHQLPYQFQFTPHKLWPTKRTQNSWYLPATCCYLPAVCCTCWESI